MNLNTNNIKVKNTAPTANKIIITTFIKRIAKKTIHTIPYLLGNDLVCKLAILYEVLKF